MDLWALSDLCTPWCVHAVVTLRVAEHLAAGVTQIDDLAAACSVHSESLGRVLRYLAGKELFEEPSPGHFALNENSRQLLDPGVRLGFDLDGIGGRMARAWGTMLSAVENGRPAYDEVFGRSFWEDLDANPRIAADFDALMGPAGHGVPDPDIPLIGGWERVRTVVDVGGGAGWLLAEVLKAHPGVAGILVDVPRAVEASMAVFEQAGVSDRARGMAQSFFDPLPPGADVYLLKNVLADWADAEARTLLTRCAEAARPSGRVVVLGGVTANHPPSPELMMMVLVGGKSRSLQEFRALAESSGLEVARAEQHKRRFVVECWPRRPGVEAS